MKPGRGPHVRIGVLANFTPSLGTRLSKSLNGDGDCQAGGLRSPDPSVSPNLRYQISLPMQLGISHGELSGLSRVSGAHRTGHAVAEERIGPRSQVLGP